MRIVEPLRTRVMVLPPSWAVMVVPPVMRRDRGPAGGGEMELVWDGLVVMLGWLAGERSDGFCWVVGVGSVAACPALMIGVLLGMI